MFILDHPMPQTLITCHISSWMTCTFSSFLSVRLGEGQPKPSDVSTEVWPLLKSELCWEVCVQLVASSWNAILSSSSQKLDSQSETKTGCKFSVTLGLPLHWTATVAEYSTSRHQRHKNATFRYSDTHRTNSLYSKALLHYIQLAHHATSLETFGSNILHLELNVCLSVHCCICVEKKTI